MSSELIAKTGDIIHLIKKVTFSGLKGELQVPVTFKILRINEVSVTLEVLSTVEVHNVQNN